MKNLAAPLATFFLLNTLSASTVPSCEMEEYPEGATFGKKARSTFLESLDKMLSLAFDPTARHFKLDESRECLTFHCEDEEIRKFIITYGFFSNENPIVGRVTKSHADTCALSEILQLIKTKIRDPIQLQVAIGELLTKVLAYRDLQENETIDLPRVRENGEVVFTRYKIDKVFDLWHKMPAYGLIPQEKGVSSLLLFRGTDFSLVSERGWASLISDLEIKDPGYFAFLNAKGELHAWLKKVAEEKKPARVMGYSLGGVLTIYTLLELHPFLSQSRNELSLAFNPPGVTREVVEEWESAFSDEAPPFRLFVNRGDLVSKLGKLLGDAYELSLPTMLKPLAAHTALFSLEPLFFMQKIHLENENATRSD